MQVFQCEQRRCRHRVTADEAPANCPRCGCAWTNAADVASSLDWSEYRKADLLEAAAEHEVEIPARSKVADIITALEAAGCEPEVELAE